MRDMRRRLAGLVLLCAAAAASAQTPASPDWGPDPAGKLQKLFEKIADASGLEPRPELKYSAELRDVDFDCKERVVKEGVSPGLSRQCGNESFIILGFGAFETSENEDQLAFLVSHELSHLVMRHDELANDFELKTCGGWLDGTDVGRRIQAAIRDKFKDDDEKAIQRKLWILCDDKFKQEYSDYSRAQEREADAEALDLMQLAGYDPRQGGDALRRAKKWVEALGRETETVFHDSDEQRAERVEALARLLHP